MTRLARKNGLFASRRRFLGVAAGVLLLGVVGPSVGDFVRAQSAEQRHLQADKAAEMIGRNALMLVDVRSPREWRDTGIPKSARTVTIHDPEGFVAFVEKIVAASDGDLNRPVGLICAAGVRSSYAYKLLQERGFTNVYNVTEGMFGNPNYGPGWLKRDLPIEPCEDC
ncbi:rhodanese-like domain-containing protein [Limibacillus sp. MBR-115]|jgi:rhodanese-related sulfurtransferase|uniref:rhodanese-like domain-containing protein n=1 Tax=Limibacillus sp. MBR-115 TaxID=3156465 RepID=UPI003396E588